MKQNFHVLSETEFSLFKSGDNLAFKKVFDYYQPALFKFVFSFTKSHHDTEEVVQEAFIALHNNRENLQDPEGVYPYLYVVAKRTLISEFRKNVIRAQYKSDIANFRNDSTDDTREKIAHKDLHEAIVTLMEQLPIKERQAYKLNKMDGLSYQEVAEISGSSKNTVKNQIISASKKMKWKLDQIYFWMSILGYLM